MEHESLSPERYQPTPEDRAPESPELQTTNEEFLSDLETKKNAPLSVEEQRSSNQAKIDTERIMADSRPKNGEATKDVLDRLSEQMAVDIENKQWLKLDDNSKKLFNDTHKLYKQIAKELLTKKGNPVLVILSESAKSVIDQLENFTDDFNSAKMAPEQFTPEIQKIYDRLVGIEAQLSRAEKRKQ